MSGTPEQRALDILEASLELPEAEQADFLARAALDDPTIAAELKRLEPARREATRSPAHLAFEAMARESERARSIASGQTPPSPDASWPERIGPFRLVRLLGVGGMGSVFEAERVEGGFEQRVAIKLLSRRYRSPELEQQFAIERRLLARVEHRNIGRIYDGGTTADGRPYLIMEFVDGVPITTYTESRRSSVDERVALFAQLCGALQYAHQQLVLHADVKPSNVLVALDGSVKLVDFGIGELIETLPQNGGTALAATPSGAALTVAYAAPERRSGGRATVSADVYGLGRVLEDLLRSVPAVAPDLASIVTRATAADPAARYASVAELREDLARWREQLPVRAHAGGWAYRAGRLLARNRLTTAVGAITVLGLVAATIATSQLYLRADRALRSESSLLADFKNLNQFLVNDLSVQMSNRPGMVEANWDTLTTTAERLDTLAAERPGDVRLQLELARSLSRIGENAIHGPRPTLQGVRDMRRRLEAVGRRLEPFARDDQYGAQVRASRADLARLQAIAALRSDGDTAEALRLADQAIAWASEAQQRAPESNEVWVTLIAARVTRGAALHAASQTTLAIAAFEQAMAEQERAAALVGLPSMKLRLKLVGLDAEFLRCDAKRWTRPADEARRDCLAILDKLRAAVRADGALVAHESRLAYTLFLLATLPSDSQTRAARESALAQLDEAHDIYERILHFGEDDRLRSYLLVVEAARSSVLLELDRAAEAREAAQSVLAARRERLRALPGDHTRRREVATALRRVADAAERAGDRTAACEAYREADRIWTDMEREGVLLPFDLATPSGHVPWVRRQLTRCPAI